MTGAYGGHEGRGVHGNWSLRPGRAEDVETAVELRAAVMRPDLERLGRYDPDRVRQRVRDGFSPVHTRVIEAGGAFTGCVTFRPYETAEGLRDGFFLEHFYLVPEAQGRGLGAAVLRRLLDRADAEGAPVRLGVLQGSPARRLYERAGFTVEAEDPVDVWMVRPASPLAPPYPSAGQA